MHYRRLTAMFHLIDNALAGQCHRRRTPVYRSILLRRARTEGLALDSHRAPLIQPILCRVESG